MCIHSYRSNYPYNLVFQVVPILYQGHQLLRLLLYVSKIWSENSGEKIVLAKQVVVCQIPDVALMERVWRKGLSDNNDNSASGEYRVFQ